MAKQSGQKFIKRNRPPRVHITYENPTNAEEKIEIPFVMGVMSDLSGNTPGVEKEEISQRKFLDVRHGQSRQPNGGHSARRQLPGRKQARRKGRREDGRKSCASTRWPTFEPAAVAQQVPARGQAAGGATAARQSDALHGRQGRGRRHVAQIAGRSATDGGIEEPRLGRAAARPKAIPEPVQIRRE